MTQEDKTSDESPMSLRKDLLHEMPFRTVVFPVILCVVHEIGESAQPPRLLLTSQRIFHNFT